MSWLTRNTTRYRKAKGKLEVFDSMLEANLTYRFSSNEVFSSQTYGLVAMASTYKWITVDHDILSLLCQSIQEALGIQSVVLHVRRTSDALPSPMPVPDGLVMRESDQDHYSYLLIGEPAAKIMNLYALITSRAKWLIYLFSREITIVEARSQPKDLSLSFLTKPTDGSTAVMMIDTDDDCLITILPNREESRAVASRLISIGVAEHYACQ